MKVLFVGGTGLISSACTALAVERGIEVFHLNRGGRSGSPLGVTTLVADVHDEAASTSVLADHRFDAVVDWIGYGVEDVERDMRLFRDRTDQFIYISSASVYLKPLSHWLMREDSPLGNPYWDYAQGKIKAEERLTRAFREDGFPITIVRPSHTYGNWSVPMAVSSWSAPYTEIARMRAGKPIIVPGDGTSLWTVMHNSDFAVAFDGLLGRRQAIGHAFNIMSDEPMTWDEIHRQIAAAAGAELRIVHIPSDFISACVPDMRGRLLGDAAVSSVFDTTKIKRFVPEFRCVMPFSEGIKQTIAWYDADPARKKIDVEADARWDHVVEVYERGLAAAVKEFAAES